MFVEYPSVECSTVESRPFHATTDAGLVRCARSFAPVKSSLAFDGQVLSPSGFVVSTGAFSFTMPATHNFLEISGKTGGRAAVYGQGLMVGPLTPGTAPRSCVSLSTPTRRSGASPSSSRSPNRPPDTRSEVLVPGTQGRRTSPVAPNHPATRQCLQRWQVIRSDQLSADRRVIDGAARVLGGLRRRETDSVRPEPDAGDEG